MSLLKRFLTLFKAEPVPTPQPPPYAAPDAPLAVPDKPPMKLAPPHANFDMSVLYVLANEGGFVDNRNDRGGATNYGITSATYSQFKGRAVSVDEVRHMPLADAKAIYKLHYWRPEFEQLDQGVATAIMDWGVLHGTNSSQKLAQEVANNLGAKLVADGDLGPTSVNAINQINPKSFLAAFSSAVKSYCIGIVRANPSQKVFLAGWEARADRMASLA